MPREEENQPASAVQPVEGRESALRAARSRFSLAQHRCASRGPDQLEQVATSVAGLEGELNDARKGHAAEQTGLARTAESLGRWLDSERTSLQESTTSASKGLQELDTLIAQQLVELSDDDGVRRVEQLLDSRVSALAAEASAQRDHNNRLVLSVTDATTHALDELERTMQAESSAREVLHSAKLTALKEDMSSLQHTIDTERKMREEMEELLLRRISDIGNQLEASLQAEMHERKSMHSALEALLDTSLKGVSE